MVICFMISPEIRSLKSANVELKHKIEWQRKDIKKLKAQKDYEQGQRRRLMDEIEQVSILSELPRLFDENKYSFKSRPFMGFS